jgi:hypothetical protein
MSARDFVIWESTAGTKYAVLGALQRVDKVYEIKRGAPRADGFPSDACFEMDKRFPRQVKLADSPSNLEGMVVVSAPLKALLESTKPPSVELLRVSIINHKGRVASEEYFIVNPLRVIDCIDKTRSEIKWNAIDTTAISGCLRLVLDLGAVDDDVLLLRPKHLENVVAVRRDLAESITAGGFTGVDFTEVDTFEI